MKIAAVLRKKLIFCQVFPRLGMSGLRRFRHTCHAWVAWWVAKQANSCNIRRP
jgi:hypothetical protein